MFSGVLGLGAGPSEHAKWGGHEMKRKLIFWIIFQMIVVAPVFAEQSDIPNAHLRIGVRQKEDGKIGEGIHIMELRCWNGQCSLTTVSLNQCSDLGFGNAFYPIVERSSTAEGTLKVENRGNVLMVQELGFIGGKTTINMRFQYQPVSEGEVISKLTGFSGGFVKNSAILHKVITCEYIPYAKPIQSVKLDCDVLVPGIDE